eukprot:129311-Hanusia_phi.AAC.1
MGDGDVQDQAHPIGGEPLREVDVTYFPAVGAMLRHLGPSAAYARRRSEVARMQTMEEPSCRQHRPDGPGM